MGTPIKVTVIGAGSATFSLGLVKDLCLTENLAGSHVTFMDIDAERLEMIHRLAERYIGELGGKLTFDETTDRAKALREADFVINTAGGEYSHWQERRDLAKKHGYYSGAGFGVNYYNLKLMLDVARDMEKICPDAWLIQSGNPVYQGTTLMTRETGIKIIGLCHGHYGYITIAQVLGLDPAKVVWTAPGLNHTIWLTEFRYEGQDAYPLLDEWIETKAEAYWQDRVDHPEKYGLEDQMSRAVIDQYRRFGLLPVGDTTRGGGWWYKTDLETRVHWYGPTGGFSSDLHSPPFIKRHYQRIEEIRQVVADPSRSVLEAFPPVKTREQQVPIIDALVNDVAAKFQINVPNQGAVPGIPDDVVAEMPAYIDKGGIHRLQVNPLPKKIMIEVIWPMILSMEWELEAFLTGDRDMLLDGLLMVNTYQAGGHTVSYEQAKGYLDDMLAQPYNRDMAEHFPLREPSWARVLKRKG
ncbi:MAG: alpha-glucosidase/alpha-galactosidase [Chloroflexi bacterium]|nr:alpha-glucosidase/alpha-galactosidase [Chloroflexota bacterium]